MSASTPTAAELVDLASDDTDSEPEVRRAKRAMDETVEPEEQIRRTKRPMHEKAEAIQPMEVDLGGVFEIEASEKI